MGIPDDINKQHPFPTVIFSSMGAAAVIYGLASFISCISKSGLARCDDVETSDRQQKLNRNLV